MPFNFSYVCDLLDTLEKPYLRDAPYLPDHMRQYTQMETFTWFKRYKDQLNDNTTHHNAVMGMLRPGSWSDRIYGWEPDNLEPLIARFLRLTRVQRAALHRWKTEPHTGDLGAQVGRIMMAMKETTKTMTSLNSNKVTIETLDTLFLSIASQNKGSSPEIQSLATAHQDQSPIDELREIYAQLQPREAKWLTRLLLKTTAPVTVPTDFGVASFRSQLPNCVKVHIALPVSAQPILRIGVTGMVKPSPAQKQAVIHTPTLPLEEQLPPSSRNGSPETDLRSPVGVKGSKKNFKSMQNRVSKPDQTLQKWNGPLHQLPPSNSDRLMYDPVLANEHPQSPEKKRRRLSREISPGLLAFQRGILQPTRPTKLSSNLSFGNTLSGLALHKDVPLYSVKRQEGNALDYPTFQLSSSQKRKIEADAEIPTPPRARPSQSSDLELLAAYSKSTNQTKETVKPLHVHISQMKSRKNASKGILPTPPTADIPLPERPLSNSTSVVQRSGSGSGSCNLTDSTCPLAACIFLVPTTIPAAITRWIFTKLLPNHGCLYITAVEHLAHPSLPRRCPVTNMKYRRIVLIEPKDKEKSGQLLQQVENLDLTRSQGRKYWCEVFDWRLLEGVTKRESGIEGSGANPWKKYWLTAV